ncbi:MAG: hypothetical protein FWF57_00510 [Defluviitaleaceae bacterium]|nr:hypothetical protein [Defluviitaleaceae bacterium]
MKKNIVVMLLSSVLVGCGANDLFSYESNDVYYSFTDNLHTVEIDKAVSSVNARVETDTPFPEIITDDKGIDIVTLEETIVKSMSFWHEVLYLRGRFSQEHLGHYSEVWDFPQHKPILRAYQRVLPTSGFESLQDIKDYLLQFYTESFLESVFSSDNFPSFIEYDNTLYIHTARIGFASSKLETAVYTLIEHSNEYSIVETSVLRTVWDMFPNLIYRGNREEFVKEAREQILRGDTFFPQDSEHEIQEFFYHFNFIDNRIESIMFQGIMIESGWMWVW